MPLPKVNRVLRSAEFRQIYQAGVRMSSRYFSVFCIRTTAGQLPARLGFTVPRAIGKAIIRNRVKRRVREAVRLQLFSIPAGCAIVFNPRRNVLDAPFDDLCREVGRIFTRCNEL